MIDGLDDVLGRVAAIQAAFAPTSTNPTPSSGTSSAFAAALLATQATTSGATAAATPLSTALGGSLDLTAPTSATAATGAAAPTAGTGTGIVAAASRYLGVPYRWGGTDPATGLDCSGLVQRVLADNGITAPRVAADQAGIGQPVADLSAAQPGDLVFFGSPADHVGIYVGNGEMLDAPHTGAVVRVEQVWGTPSSIRRVTATAAAASAADPLSGYQQLFAAAGARYGVDPALLKAVATVESHGNASAVSPAGAEGLMQLMPTTAASLGVNPLIPAQAVDGAARLLQGYLASTPSLATALAAYNAGPTAVRAAGNAVPDIPETRAYVAAVEAQLPGGVA